MMYFKLTLFLFCFLFSYVIPTLSFAQLYTGPVSAGVGGAGAASVEVIESSFLNPATLAHAPTFVGGIFYQDGFVDGEFYDTLVGINLIDNSEGVFMPGGFGFIQERMVFLEENSVNKRIWNLSLGSFIVPMFSAGISFHYVEAESGGEEFNNFNSTFGLLWNPHPDWGFAAVIHNMLGGNEKTPLYFRDFKKAVLGLTFIASEYLRFRLDGSKLLEENPEEKLEVKGGIETFLSSFAVLRLGWKNDQLFKRDVLTGGLSFIGPRFTLDYSYQQSQDSKSLGSLHSVDLSFPF
jgi:hypothetical protein